MRVFYAYSFDMSKRKGGTMYDKLKGRIVEKYGSQSKFARKMGVHPVSVNQKMVGKVGFTVENIRKWSEMLDIDRDEIGRYFFE